MRKKKKKKMTLNKKVKQLTNITCKTVNTKSRERERERERKWPRVGKGEGPIVGWQM